MPYPTRCPAGRCGSGGRTGGSGRSSRSENGLSWPPPRTGWRWRPPPRAREGDTTGLLVDVGSTTTDLIPFGDGVVTATGRTDTERMQSGELVYAGVRRTPVFALADRLPFRGRATALAAEMFATTLDVFLTLREVPEGPDDRSTADGRSATIDASRDRLAVVGADREGFTGRDAALLAGSVKEAFLSRLADAVGGTTTCPALRGRGFRLGRISGRPAGGTPDRGGRADRPPFGGLGPGSE